MSDRLYDQWTTGAANSILDSTLAGTYLALFTAMPGKGGGGTEVAGGGYARQAVTWASAADGVKRPSATVAFPEASASWGTVVGWALMDASSGGNMLVFGRLLTQRVLGAADTQVSITKPTATVARYTYAEEGTDPGITASNPAPGDVVILGGTTLSAANRGRFVVLASGDDWFEVRNQDGVAEAGQAVGDDLLLRLAPTSKTIETNDALQFLPGRLAVRLQ